MGFSLHLPWKKISGVETLGQYFSSLFAVQHPTPRTTLQNTHESTADAGIHPEDMKYLSSLRELYAAAGGEPYEEPRLQHREKNSDYITMKMRNGVPTTLRTPHGTYSIIGGGVIGDREIFERLLNQTFDVEVISTKNEREGTCVGTSSWKTVKIKTKY